MAEDRAVKRKRIVLTIEKKLEILDKLKSSSATSLARDFGVEILTLCNLKKNEKKIRSFYLSMESQIEAKKRKTMKNASYVQLDKAGKLVNLAHSLTSIIHKFLLSEGASVPRLLDNRGSTVIGFAVIFFKK